MRTKTAVTHHQITKQFLPEHVVPSSRADQVSPTPQKHILGIPILLLTPLPESILPHIKAQIGTAPIRERVVEFRINIEEMITENIFDTTVLIDYSQSRPCYQIQPRTTYRDIKRGAILNNRPLQIGPCGKQTHGDIPVILLPVTVIHTDIYNRREPSAVFRRKAPFIKPGILYRVRVERREKPQQMVHMIDRISIQQIQILIGPAPTHIQAGHSLGAYRHARQLL